MKLAIMQPYFFPYIGYFQLIAAVDLFIVYDDIKYTKKGWINRNRMLLNDKHVLFSLPLKNDSDALDVRERELAPDFKRDKLLNRFNEAYRCAPYYAQTYPLIEEIVQHEDPNLFRFLHNSLVKTCSHLGISTAIRISSEVTAMAHKMRNRDKVLYLCEVVGASEYVNAIGGRELYSKESFSDKGIGLKFIKSKPFEYQQFGGEFLPWLSVIDVMMFNSIDSIQTLITSHYELI